MKKVLGLVGCSDRKLPIACAAKYLYSYSPAFALVYQAAVKECSIVKIISGKYILVDPEEVIAPYNQVADFNARQIKILSKKIKTLRHKKCISWLSAKYAVQVHPILLSLGMTIDHRAGGLVARAKRIGKVGRLKYHVVWPIHFLMVAVAEGKIKNKNDLIPRLKGYSPKTVDAQWYRICHCPALMKYKLHYKETQGLWNEG